MCSKPLDPFAHAKFLLSSLIFLFLSGAILAQEEGGETELIDPNILIIILDDIGQQELAIYNQDAAASLPYTPTMDALACLSTVFNNAYAYPTCSPTRASILTGRYGFRTGVGNPVGQTDTSLATEFTLPEAFALYAPNYQLAQFGKWHLGGGTDGPNSTGGWPHFEGALGGGVGDFYSWQKITNGVQETVTNYATTENVDDFLSWHTGLNPSAPWFSWIAFNAPHTPFHVPPASLHHQGILTSTEEAIDANPRPYYEAAIEAIDTEMARILEAIDLDETIIIFVGDNGTPNQARQSHYPNRVSKGTLYEGGINIPMFVYDPRVSIPTHNNTPIHVVDLFATIAEFGGINFSNFSNLTLDSVSLVSLYTGEAAPENSPSRDEFVYAEEFDENDPTDGGKVVRNERYKLIQLNNGSAEFYDLFLDPREQNDLSAGTLSEDQQLNFQNLSTYLSQISG